MIMYSGTISCRLIKHKNKCCKEDNEETQLMKT